jgi:predicted ribosome quality control (RQC) complex YloA/Tae2 family protein
MKKVEEDSIIYYIGTSAKDNWDLYDKMSEDSWFFHIDNEPGSHVYIDIDTKNSEEFFPERAHIIRAAQLVKIQSKCYRNKVPIIYIQKKFIKKDTKSVGTVILLREPKVVVV